MTRADAAQAAVNAYVQLYRAQRSQPLEDQITDLIADLLRLYHDTEAAEGGKADVGGVISMARLHFEAELPPEAE
jgi:hypothetical protein